MLGVVRPRNRDLPMRHVIKLSSVLGVWLLLAGCYSARLSKADRELFWSLHTYSFSDSASEDICHVHGVATEPEEVPLSHGMCVDRPRYISAKIHRFPNSFMSLASCYCEALGPETTVRRVCAECRKAEIRWRARVGW
jgi:hypothetical protein